METAFVWIFKQNIFDKNLWNWIIIIMEIIKIHKFSAGFYDTKYIIHAILFCSIKM